MSYKRIFLCFLILAMQAKNVVAAKTSTSPYISGTKAALYFGSAITIICAAIMPFVITLNNIFSSDEHKDIALPLSYTTALIVAVQACLKCGKENCYKAIESYEKGKTLKAKKLEACKSVTKT